MKTTVTKTTTKFKGSIGWTIFWVLVFWPIAVVYYWYGLETTTRTQEQ
jgi:hypothetical protein